VSGSVRVLLCQLFLWLYASVVLASRYLSDVFPSVDSD
jgi:hypothetical protein